MADLDDLNYPSILSMGDDEAIELLRQIRLSRRAPDKRATSPKNSKLSIKAKVVTSLDATQAMELLKILEGK